MVGDVKLVRDFIPEVVARAGAHATFELAAPSELQYWLLRKLDEETGECAAAPSVEEIADVLEVLRAIARSLDQPWEAIEQYRQAKRAERGGFEKGVLMRVALPSVDTEY